MTSASTTASASPFKIFLAVFLGIVLGGGCLMAVWYRFLREAPAKPLSLTTTPSPEGAQAQAHEHPGDTGNLPPARRMQLDGEVFIVTKGGQNYKLGLVPVSLVRMDLLQPYLDRKNTEAIAGLKELEPQVAAAKKVRDQAQQASTAAIKEIGHNPQWYEHSKEADKKLNKATAEYESLVSKAKALASGAFYFDEMPAPIVATQTNADGKFTIDVPDGSYALAAHAERSVGDEIEKYYWLLQFTITAEHTAIMLSNNNLTSSSSPGSLVHTIDAG